MTAADVAKLLHGRPSYFKMTYHLFLALDVEVDDSMRAEANTSSTMPATAGRIFDETSSRLCLYRLGFVNSARLADPIGFGICRRTSGSFRNLLGDTVQCQNSACWWRRVAIYCGGEGRL